MITILLFLAIIGVIRVLWQIFGNQKHLDTATIRLFMLNQLPEKERNRVISHLGICEACQDRLTNYNNGTVIEDHLIAPDE